METTKQIDGKVLNLSISGHIDATTAPELEKIVSGDLAKVEKVVFQLHFNRDSCSSGGDWIQGLQELERRFDANRSH